MFGYHLRGPYPADVSLKLTTCSAETHCSPETRDMLSQAGDLLSHHTQGATGRRHGAGASIHGDDAERAPTQVAAGTLKVPIGKTFGLDDIVEAHRCMDENRAGGKIVILP